MTQASGSAPPENILEHIRRQRLAAVVRIEQPLLYCSQVQRSGGTLLTRLLDGHRSCFVHPNELRLGRPDAWPVACHLHTATAAFEVLRESWPRKFSRNGYSKVAGRPQPGQSDTLPFLFDEDLQRQIFAQAFERTRRTQRDVLNAYLTSLFNAWLDYQNLYVGPKRWVVAFEPRFLVRKGSPELFFADYPDGRLVTIVREPSAWLASYRKHIPSHDTDKALRYWLESLDAGLRALAAYPERVEVLLFDDLVHRTEAVMRRLCERLGIVFDTSMLAPTCNSMPVPSDSSHVTSFDIDPLVTQRQRMRADDVPESAAALAEACARYEEVKPRFSLASLPPPPFG